MAKIMNAVYKGFGSDRAYNSDEDPDYNPSGILIPTGHKHKHHATVNSYNKKSKTRKVCDTSYLTKSSTQSLTSCDWSNLPVDILLQIVQHLISDYGIIPVYRQFSQVCKQWSYFIRVESRNYSRSLWCNAHLSLPCVVKSVDLLDSVILPMFPNLTTIDLTCWTKLRDENILAIAESFGSTLTHISLGGSKLLTEKSILHLCSHCSEIKSLHLERLSGRVANGRVLCNFLSQYSHCISSFVIRGIASHLSSFGSLLQFISKPFGVGCDFPQLTEFTISEIVSNNFAVIEFSCENLARRSPKLRKLCLSRLNLSSVVRFQFEEPVFNNLETLDFSNNYTGLHVHSPLFIEPSCLPNIRSLFVDKTVFTLNSNSSFACLEELSASGSQPTVADGGSFLGLLMKCPKLQSLNISWIKEEQQHVFDASEPALKSLKKLDISGINASLETIRELVSSIKCLSALNVESCKCLPRGYKRHLTSNKDIRKWLKHL